MENPAPSPFECNVCFEQASIPVVTPCGHLFCWNCLSSWLRRAEDCPVCKAKVTRETVVPIFGRGQSTESHANLDSDPLPRPGWIPPDPRVTRQVMGRDVGFSIGAGGFPFLPFVGFSFNSGNNQHVLLTVEQRRQRMVTQFFIFIGVVLLILIISS